MANTDISICSRALVLLGARPISSFQEETDNAITCRNAYPGLRDQIIGGYGWRCMMVKKKLTQDAAGPVGEWKNSFIIPGEAVALPHAIFHSQFDTLASHEYEVFGRRVYTNHDKLFADFVTRKPESEWPEYFVALMVAALCADIAFAVTDQNGVSEKWERRAYGSPGENGVGGLMGEARSIDAQSGGNIGLRNDAFVDARFGSTWPAGY